MNNLLKLLGASQLAQSFLKKQELANLSINQEALTLAGAFFTTADDIVVVKEDLYSAQLLYRNLLSWLGEEKVWLFGGEESLRVAAIANSPELKVQRIDTLANSFKAEKRIVVTHLGALILYLPDTTVFKEKIINLRVNDKVDRDDLKKRLLANGYGLVNRVDQPLVFSYRGNIVDVWPANFDYPLRIEFFDDEIESLRYFDSSQQTTLELTEQAECLPASDNIFTESDYQKITHKTQDLLAQEKKKLAASDYEELEHTINRDLLLIQEHSDENHLYRYRCYTDSVSILDYFPKATVVLSDYETLDNHYKNLLAEQIQYLRELYEDRQALLSFQHQFEWFRLLEKRKIVNFNKFYQADQVLNNDIIDISVANNSLKIKLREIFESSERKLFVINQHKLPELLDELIRQDIEYQIITEDDEISGDILVMPGDLQQGFYLRKEKLNVYTNKELFFEVIKTSRYEKKFTQAQVLSDYQELEIKDYIVHYHHGIGQYLGIVTRVQDGIHCDYLQILYRNNAMLYVPLEQFKLVRKYLSNEGISPKLSSLGSGEWRKTKEKISQNVQDIAERLMNLYAEREKTQGFAFSPDNEIQEQFENEFIYELTPDQKLATNEIKADMQSSKPMDRLLCGDVGFGKTEVAIRAACKAVLDGKQVAYLCPTTILSNQHYQTFSERFANYPVKIALLNRYVSDGEQKAIIKKLKNQEIDILIGTHRILSDDVLFKDLGLLIIDEEQRFGVLHKEKIKELKTNIDVLSLSATPIPRTLQMSLIGIRALSQLNTPPLYRISVQTSVIEKNTAVIKEVIHRELARSGQVFYLHNNIETIYTTARRLNQLVENAKVAVAHGRMDKEEIENVMLGFINKEYDVLVCTTIIETGIDIPNVNTILIDQADNFGLSQLYQIKGRVGRSSVLAYAYLMYNPQKQLSEVAVKRLKAIKDFAQLGSGYKIAMRDLTIRGAGDLLGPNQSGFINSVGIDLYLELLNEAILKKKGLYVEEPEEKDLSIKEVDGYIPKHFTDYDLEKINLYQEIEKCKKLSSLAALIDRTKDLYGRLPEAVSLLFEKRRLEILVKDKRVDNFRQLAKGVEIVFTKEYSSQLDGITLFEQMNKINVDIQLKFLREKVIVFIPENIDWLDVSIKVLEQTKL